MTRVVLEGNLVIKRYDQEANRDREAMILQEMACLSSTRAIVPRVVQRSNKEGEPNPFCLSISRLEGEPLSGAVLNETIVRELALLVSDYRMIARFCCCGSFLPDLSIEEPEPMFSRYVFRQLEKWAARLTKPGIGKSVIPSLFEALEFHRPRLDRLGPAEFSHNDLGPQNILCHKGRLSGVVDWEHAGSYPWAWEMRKLFPALFWDRPGLGQLFSAECARLNPKLSMPNEKEQALLVAVDCIGALGWAQARASQEEAGRSIRRLESALSIFT